MCVCVRVRVRVQARIISGDVNRCDIDISNYISLVNSVQCSFIPCVCLFPILCDIFSFFSVEEFFQHEQRSAWN